MLLSLRIVQVLSVDGPASHEGDVVDAVGQDHGAVPLTATLGPTIVGKILGAQDGCARIDPERHIILQMNGSRDVSARGDQNGPAASVTCGLNGLVDGVGIRTDAVTDGAEILDVELSRGLRQGYTRGPHKQPERKSTHLETH